jgi:uncharacterized protein (TIGR02444 family)
MHVNMASDPLTSPNNGALPQPQHNPDNAVLAATVAAEESFWRFSLSLYARPGVADALIALQDRYECDVNLALFALWSGVVGARRLARDDVAAARAAIAGLNAEIIEPLRRMRGKFRGVAASDVHTLRRRILRLELAGERSVQQRLAATLISQHTSVSIGDRLAAARSNLSASLGVEAASSPEADRVYAALSGLIRANG